MPFEQFLNYFQIGGIQIKFSKNYGKYQNTNDDESQTPNITYTYITPTLKKRAVNTPSQCVSVRANDATHTNYFEG